MESAVVDLAHVRKVYRGKVEALAGISLRVPAGSVFGLLGPNGAGKSTLVKILTTVIRPTRCEGTMLGRPVGDKQALRRVGYLPEHARFPGYLTGRQVIEFSAGLSGLSPRAVRSRIDELLALVGMSEWGNRKVQTYSKGMKQRIGIAQALVSDPELLFLDEPTDGVDPEGRREIRLLIARMRAEGRTVFLNTHLLSELEQVADRVAILSKGMVVKEGVLEDLVRARQHYEIEIEGELDEELAREISVLGGTHAGSVVRFEGQEAGDVQPLIDALRRRGVVLRALTPKRQTLEELFLEAVEESRATPTP